MQNLRITEAPSPQVPGAISSKSAIGVAIGFLCVYCTLTVRNLVCFCTDVRVNAATVLDLMRLHSKWIHALPKCRVLNTHNIYGVQATYFESSSLRAKRFSGVTSKSPKIEGNLKNQALTRLFLVQLTASTKVLSSVDISYACSA